MTIRWVALNMAGQRVGEPVLAPTLRDAYDLAYARYGVAVVQVQSLVSWDAAEDDRSIADRMRRLRYDQEDV
jgi:hypothetical protein